MTAFYEDMTKEEIYRQWKFFETDAKRSDIAATYYRKQLAEAHELLGRVVHQASERWDTLNISEYFPTDNLHHKRTNSNPSGEKEDTK